MNRFSKFYLLKTFYLLTIFLSIENRLLKAKLQEINGSLVVSKSLNGDIFHKFEATVAVINQMWQKQEEIKRKRAIEEESLYVNK